MKIVQVISSNIPIQPTGKRTWGAVELIMEEYRKKLIDLGHTVEFKWLDNVINGEQDIVQIHVANLCLEARDRGIPYIYSNHDHTSVHYGKGSWLYNQQLEAIKGSVFSITHAESVINFFDETDKLFYLPHGVDTMYYQPNFFPVKEKKLLMVASNGMAGDYGIDRKGFRLGIEAAKTLDLPITIVGSEANAEFFKIHSDLLAYPKLTVDSSNPTEDKKLEYFQTHSVFLHPSSLEFGSPNLTLLEAWACGLPMVAAYDGRNKISGLVKLDKLDAGEIAEKVVEIYQNYDVIRNPMLNNRYEHDWRNTVSRLVKMYRSFIDVQKETTTKSAREQYLNIYQ